jgi:hypothetical protein
MPAVNDSVETGGQLSGGWEAEACTPPGVYIALLFVGVVFNVSSHLYDSCRGSDCMLARFS